MQEASRHSQTTLRQSVVQNQFFHKLVQKIGFDYLACILVFIGSITWTIGFLYPNQHNFSFAITVYIRGICVVIISYFLCRRMHFKADFKDPTTFYQLFYRNGVMVIHGITFAIIPFYLPQFIIHTISCAGPLFVFVVDYYKYGTTINGKQFFGLGTGVIGLILTINGQLITSLFNKSYQFHTQFTNYKTDNLFVKALMSIWLLLIMAAWGYAACVTKKINSNGVQINLYLGILLTIVGGIIYPSTVDFQSLPSAQQLITGFFLSGMVIAAGQVLYIVGLSICINSGIVTLMSFNAVILSYLISIFRYGEDPNLICLIGGGLIIYGVVTVVFNKQKILRLSHFSQNNQSHSQQAGRTPTRLNKKQQRK